MNANALYSTWRGLPGISRAAIGLLAAAAVVLLWVSPKVLSALFAGSLYQVTQGVDSGDAAALAYNEAVKSDVDFISKRSPFFTPARPRVEREPVIVDTQPRPATPPRTYGGPKLVGFAGSEGAVFDSNVFNSSPFLRVGDKGGSLELLGIEKPWKAKVRWAGSEFELNLFDRLEALPVVNFGGGPGGAAPAASLFGNPASTAAGGAGLDFGDDVASEEAATGDNN